MKVPRPRDGGNAPAVDIRSLPRTRPWAFARQNLLFRPICDIEHFKAVATLSGLNQHWSQLWLDGAHRNLCREVATR